MAKLIDYGIVHGHAKHPVPPCFAQCDHAECVRSRIDTFGSDDGSDTLGWYCTREIEHDGPHQAHEGPMGRILCTWDDEKEQPKPKSTSTNKDQLSLEQLAAWAQRELNHDVARRRMILYYLSSKTAILCTVIRGTVYPVGSSIYTSWVVKPVVNPKENDHDCHGFASYCYSPDGKRESLELWSST